jgi:NAD(P)-dependent dehydrogenase (short-subunit alcohol dehydrogenase family)
MPTGELVVMQCNLASFEEIRAFAAKLQQQRINIDFLVLNAAIAKCPKWYTKEGHELQMGVNFIGHFHLVQLLLPTMRAQSAPARIVAVTCKSELDGSLRMTDLNFSKVNYDPYKAYKGSKVALALWTKELAARVADSNITVFAADPGATGDTMLNKYMGPLAALYIFSKPFLKSLQQAVATPLFALVAPATAPGSKRRSSLRGHSSGIASGSLLSDCKVVTNNRTMGSAHMAKRVWEEAEQLVDRSVLNSHIANAGFEGNESSLWVLNTVLRPLMDFLLRMFGLRKY